MKSYLFATRAMRRPLLAGLALAGGAVLSGCVAYPAGPSPVLSRLPPTTPGAAATHPKPLTKAEQQRYDRIDKQVLHDQNRALDAQAAAQAAASASYYEVAPVPVYGGYPAYYDGYYGGYPAYYGGYYGPGW